LFLVEQTVSN